MPIIKSAIKKMRVDERRRARNVAVMSKLRTSLKRAQSDKSFETVSDAYAALDKAVKINLVHKNFANRHKSQLSKLAKPSALKVAVKPVKKAPKATKTTKTTKAKSKSPAKKAKS